MMNLIDDKDPILEKLSGLHGVFEANSFEINALWKKYHQDKKHTWEDDPGGIGIAIGSLLSRPIMLSLHWFKFDGKQMMVINPTSQLVDWKMIDEWFKLYVKDSDGNPLKYKDANTFRQLV